MKNNRHLNALEVKLAELHENFGNCIISEDEVVEQYYIENDCDSWTTDSKAELMETIIYDLNEWFNDSYPTDTINGNTLESVGDYLPLFLALPNDCTVLAVGNGAVAAPSTTTAMLHEDTYGNKFLAVYDYEVNEEDTRSTLEELFPSRTKWAVTFNYEDRDTYYAFVEAENQAEAITNGFADFGNNCKWSSVPWEFVKVEAEKAEYWAEYSHEADRTFIMKEDAKGKLSVVGWYCGEPSEENTKTYIGKL